MYISSSISAPYIYIYTHMLLMLSFISSRYNLTERERETICLQKQWGLLCKAASLRLIFVKHAFRDCPQEGAHLPATCALIAYDQAAHAI